MDVLLASMTNNQPTISNNCMLFIPYLKMIES